MLINNAIYSESSCSKVIINSNSLTASSCFDRKRSNSAFDFLQAVVEIVRFIEVRISVNHVLRLTLVEELSVLLTEVVDLLNLTFVKPLDTLAVFPQTEFGLIFFRHNVIT